MNPNAPNTNAQAIASGTKSTYGESAASSRTNNVVDNSLFGAMFPGMASPSPMKIMGAVAGVATAASLSALAYYALQKTGVDPTYVVDPSLITHVANFGSHEQVNAVFNGMSQIQQVFTQLNDAHDGKARVFDLWQELGARGVGLDEFKSAVVDHFTRVDGTQAKAIIDKLLDPDTRLTASVQSRLGEVIWAHDKSTVLREVSAQDALEFAKSGMGVALASSAAAVFTHPKITRPIQQAFESIKTVAQRVGAELGLINDDADREIRRTIKANAFDPAEARAQLAAEYAERESSTHRFFTLTWMKARDLEDRNAMLQLFGMEKVAMGKHTTVGQAIMIDNFTAKELRDLAAKEPDYADALSSMAARRSELERLGKRSAESQAALGEDSSTAPTASITELMQAYQSKQAHSSRATAPA